MWKQIVGITLALGIGALSLQNVRRVVFSGAGREIAPAQEHIGALFCLSGGCAEWGNNSRRGAELALAEINERGGVLGRTLMLSVEDTRESEGGTQTVAAYQKLRSDGVRLFLGPNWTPGGLSLAPIIARDKNVLALSPSLGVADFNEAGTNLFNLWPHDYFATAHLARYAVERGWKTAAVMSSQQPWEFLQGKTFAEDFTRRGGTVPVIETPLPAVSDFRGEIAHVIAAKPEVIFLSCFEHLGVAAKQIRMAGYRGPLLAILMDQSRIDSAQGALEGAVFARYRDPDPEFSNKFRRRYGEAPGISADTAYDAVYALVRAVQHSGTFESSDISALLMNIHFQGASGEIRFDAKGGVVREPVLYTVIDGKQRVLE